MEQEVDAAELEHIIGFSGQEPHSLVLHPFDSNIVLHGIGHVVVLSDQTDPHKQDLLRGHDNIITAVAFSSSGRMLASGQKTSAHRDGEQIVVWDYDSRKPLYRLSGVEGTVISLKFSEDDRFLAAVGEGLNPTGNDVAIWDMQSGSIAQFIKCPRNAATCICWGRTMVADPSRRVKTAKYTLYTFQSVQVQAHFLEYDLRTMSYALKSEAFKFPAAGLQRTYYDCCLAPSQGELVAGTSVGELMVFSTDNLLYRAALPVATNGVLSLCAGGEFLFVGCGDGKVKKLQGNDQYWSIASEVQLGGRVTSLCKRAEVDELLAGTNAARLFGIRADDLSARILQESNVAAVRGVAFGRRSDVFASIADDGSLRVTDLSDYGVVVRARGPCGGAAVCFCGDDRLLTGWDDGAVRIYSAVSGELVNQIAKGHRGRVTCVGVSEDSLLTGGEDGAVRVWSRRSLEFLGQFSEHSKPLTGLLADRTQRHLVHSCSLDRSVVTYDLRTSRRCNYRMHKDGGFTGLRQRVDSEQELLTTTTDGFILAWDCDVQLPVMALECGKRLKFTCIDLSSSGRYAAVGCEDHAVRIWEVGSGQLVACCRGHSGLICQAAWSPDEKQLVTVGEDKAVCVWNFYLGAD